MLNETVKHIEVMAANGEKMPAAMAAPEQALFEGLRYLYAAFRLKQIDMETASKEKAEMITEFHNFNKLRDAYMNDGLRWAKASQYAAEIERSDCEAAKKMVRIMDGRDKA